MRVSIDLEQAYITSVFRADFFRRVDHYMDIFIIAFGYTSDNMGPLGLSTLSDTII